LKLLSEDIDKQQGELNTITSKRTKIYLTLDKLDRDINEANEALDFLKGEKNRIEKNINDLSEINKVEEAMEKILDDMWEVRVGN
jgi:peptidoglycan hydrolase CwlO-like protein